MPDGRDATSKPNSRTRRTTAIDSGTRNGLRMTASFEADIEARRTAGRLILIKTCWTAPAKQIQVIAMDHLFILAVLGHLTGDYLLQSKWMALTKSRPGP